MTKQEYHTKLTELQNEWELKKNSLRREFALSNNTVQIGDIIESRGLKIKVEKIGIYNGLSSEPECMYTGKELKKDNTPTKKGNDATIYQSNL